MEMCKEKRRRRETERQKVTNSANDSKNGMEWNEYGVQKKLKN